MMLTLKQRSLVILACGLLPGCAPPAPVAAVEAERSVVARSVLERSTPAAGSNVKAPLDALALRFNPPVRLTELTVTGPDGEMPMMITAVGEVIDYNIPLPGLGAGKYTVKWKALRASQRHEGEFGFSVSG